ELDASDSPALLDALHTDEQRLVALLISICDSEVEEEAVLRLNGDSAQSFLDVVQDAVDRGSLTTAKQDKKAQRIIRKLSETSDRLPSSLFIEGVTKRDVHPTFGGGFSGVSFIHVGRRVRLTLSLRCLSGFVSQKARCIETHAILSSGCRPATH
ncbi:hypothetical protein FB45DRAFT_733767, partial [Roridomyces roridus]